MSSELSGLTDDERRAMRESVRQVHDGMVAKASATLHLAGADGKPICSARFRVSGCSYSHIDTYPLGHSSWCDLCVARADLDGG